MVTVYQLKSGKRRMTAEPDFAPHPTRRRIHMTGGAPKCAVLAYLVAKYTPQATDLSKWVHLELVELRAAAKQFGVPLQVQVFYRNRREGMRALFLQDSDIRDGDCRAPFDPDPFVNCAPDP